MYLDLAFSIQNFLLLALDVFAYLRDLILTFDLLKQEQRK